MKNAQVTEAWIKGQPAKSGNLRTDGQSLYSYELRIGHTEGGRKVATDYTRTGGDFRSQTTSTHVGLAKRAGATVERPGGAS